MGCVAVFVLFVLVCCFSCWRWLFLWLSGVFMRVCLFVNLILVECLRLLMGGLVWFMAWLSVTCLRGLVCFVCYCWLLLGCMVLLAWCLFMVGLFCVYLLYVVLFGTMWFVFWCSNFVCFGVCFVGYCSGVLLTLVTYWLCLIVVFWVIVYTCSKLFACVKMLYYFDLVVWVGCDFVCLVRVLCLWC